MMRSITIIVFSISAVLFFINACPPPPKASGKKKVLNLNIPEGWPVPHYQFDKNNQLTPEGFELGRTLFYDRRLSRNNTISCGSCHQQFAAFSHLDHPISHGIDNKLGKRNTPPLFNLIWQTSFFWDGSVNHIEVQPISPMQNPVEMDEKLENVIGKIATDTTYKRRYKEAFGDTIISSQRTLKALAQFMGAMVSSNSKYDKYIRKEPGGEMTEEELNGLQVFRNNCATCHKEPLFTDFSFRNNGLPPKYNGLDSGRATITKEAADMYKFKVPSLRNLKYTWPYMHDGRFTELSQVINHYTGNRFASETLDPALKGSLFLTEPQKANLLAFLNTLNDTSFVKDPRFKDNSNSKEIILDHRHTFDKK
jgi:cytochrome c peroxidase